VCYSGEFDKDGFTYFTDSNPYDRKALIGSSETAALCPLANNVALALQRNFTHVLTSDEATKARFQRCRDLSLEKRVEEIIRELFPEPHKVFAKVSETPSGQFEHDLVVVSDENIVLAIEAKASSPEEPFRDARRSFRRLRGAFRGSGGIQKAYDQAMRVVGVLRSGEALRLFNSDGSPVVTFESGEPAEAWPICVTADNWGSLAIDVSLLLEKDSDAPLPWAVNVYDLEAFVDALMLKGLGAADFIDFIRQRSERHGRLIAGDELEIAGMFIRHGRLSDVSRDGFLQVDSAYSDIFDDIYMWRKGAGDLPDLSTKKDIVELDTTGLFREVTAQMRSAVEEWDDSIRWPEKLPGRNDRCFCGSGIKFKRCHGRLL
jgi:hypothetical protein